MGSQIYQQPPGIEIREPHRQMQTLETGPSKQPTDDFEIIRSRPVRPIHTLYNYRAADRLRIVRGVVAQQPARGRGDRDNSAHLTSTLYMYNSGVNGCYGSLAFCPPTRR